MTNIRNQSCLSDRPVKEKEGDIFKNSQYVNGLKNFIVHADTPVTIGIQGGWGSGKTSLMNMLKESLDNEDENKALCVWVNAWEHSLFQSNTGASDVAVSLLQGLVDGLKDAVAKADIAPEIQKKISGDTSNLVKVAKIVGNLAIVGLGAVAKAQFGVDIPQQMIKNENNTSNSGVVRDLHNLLERTIVDDIIDKSNNKYRIAVFFIDDLDRISPDKAVNILDMTKNIFDIRCCVFVLAIDYDVVVKGLESKFGKKTKENEREFRQYFDKIIQIPFTMPVGSYRQQIKNFIISAVEQRGILVDVNNNDAIFSNIADVAFFATDGVPRAIKRIINTTFLLQHFIGKSQGIDGETDVSNFEILFIVVSLHISYPEICRRLMIDHRFTDWQLDGLVFNSNGDDIQIDSNKIKDELRSRYGDVFDEEWEQVIFFLCYGDPWLRHKARAVSGILNALRVALAYDSDRSDVHISSVGYRKLSYFLSLIRVVAVDIDGIPRKYDNSSIKTDALTVLCKNIHKELRKKPLFKDIIDVDDDNYCVECNKKRREYAINIQYKTEFAFVDRILIIFNTTESQMLIRFDVKIENKFMGKAKDICSELRGKGIFCNDNYDEFWIIEDGIDMNNAKKIMDNNSDDDRDFIVLIDVTYKKIIDTISMVCS